MGTTYESYWKNLKRNIDKIDGYPVSGIYGREGSLSYMTDSMYRDLITPIKLYGNNTWMTEDYPVKWTVVGGNNAYGTELMIYMGDTIESSDPHAYMRLNTFYLVSQSAANKISVVEFLKSTLSDEYTEIITDDSDDDFEYTGNDTSLTFNVGDRVVVTGVDTTTGISADIVYYVVNSATLDHFKLSLTSGGAGVLLGGGDGTCRMRKLTSTSLAKIFVYDNATTSSVIPIEMPSNLMKCTDGLSVRSLSENGSTISTGFLLGACIQNGN